MFAYFYWDPSPEMFHFALPLLGRPILWYGFLFALGFFAGYWVLRSRLKETLDPHKARLEADRITLFVILGAVIGARLGDLLFYQNFLRYIHDPLSIIKVWEGGLASHGGAAGILLALYILSKRPKKGLPTFSWLQLLDLVVVPTPLVGVFIRVGNFINQEILGIPTTLPWGVIFGHPADGSSEIPRHPVQLYEAAYYLIVFLVLIRASKKINRSGRLTGLFLLCIFGFRFLIEFLKTEQSALLPAAFPLNMGQLLSIPFILWGIYLLARK